MLIEHEKCAAMHGEVGVKRLTLALIIECMKNLKQTNFEHNTTLDKLKH